MVHTDYRIFVKENLTNTIYYCERIEGEYLVLNSKKFKLKVKENAIKEVLPKSTFIWNDKVSLVEKPNCEVRIDDLFWHSKDKEYKYYLIIGGKKKSKYYTYKDFEILK